ncbi:MAG TPA: flippase-like domain-containing protein [Thermoleophilaceae bacterium]
MPNEFDKRRLAKRMFEVLMILLVFLLIVLLAPGLGDVRDKLVDADPGWLVLGIVLEALSCLSYVLMFRPVFCRHMSRRTAREIAWSELGVGSLVPASGAGGLALGAWVLSRGGMPADKIARRSVAFFLIKSSVNFVAVALIGFVMAIGLVGPHKSPWLTAGPALGATIAIGLILLVPRLGPGKERGPDASGFGRALSATRRALIGGVDEAIGIVRSGNAAVIAGAIGYWLFDNAVLWATFHAFGYSPPISIILMGYLIGQLGGLLPLPGGLGGIDGGLIGTLVVYGLPAAGTTAAVLAYRVILFWLPLIVGAIAFVSLRRGLNDPERPDLCNVPEPAPA